MTDLKTKSMNIIKLFNHVAILTYEKNIEMAKRKIDEINKPIGLYILQKNVKIKTVMEPKEYNNDLDRDVIFSILRKREYESIIEKHFGSLPQVSNSIITMFVGN